MKVPGLAALMACMLLLAGPAMAASAEAGAQPQWSSDEVRAARETGPRSALMFDVRTEVKSATGAVTSSTEHVTLTSDYQSIVGDKITALNDFALCRVYAWTDAKPSLHSDSCYAEPAFLVFEIANRAYLAGMMKAVVKGPADAKPIDSDPYWAEAELGIQQQQIDRLKVRHDASGDQYLLGDRVVVRVGGPAGQLSDAEASWVTRFFAHRAPVHPQVRARIRTDHVLPAQVLTVLAAPRNTETTYIFSNLHRGMAAYPMPAGLRSDLGNGGQTPEATGQAAFVAAMGARFSPGKLSAGALLDGIKSNVAGGRNLEALMLFFDYTQQYSAELNGSDRQAIVTALRAALPTVLKDPAAAAFWNASSLAAGPQVQGDRVAALHYLAGAKQLDALPFGTFRYVTYANLIRVSGAAIKPADLAANRLTDSLPDAYWIHIAAYPWASNAYKDLGDTYLTGFDTPKAWEAYDMGRAIDPEWRTGVMANVPKLESQIRAAAPDFF